MDQCNKADVSSSDQGDPGAKKWNLRARKPTLQQPNAEEEESDAEDVSYDDGGDEEEDEEEEEDDNDEDDNDDIMEDESVKDKPKLCSNVQNTSSSTVSSMDHS